MEETSFWMVRPAQNQEAFQTYMERRLAGEQIDAAEMEEWLVCHTDHIQLLHMNTTTFLRTHDVASPLTATNMEFTTAPRNQTADTFADTIWELRVDGADTNDTVVQTSASFVRLVSARHGVAMHTHAKKLPADWGRGHQEINGNKKPGDKSNVWVIPLIRGRKASDAERQEMKRKIKKIGFFEKYAELQALMIKHNNALTSTHPFQSGPLSWPFLTRGVSFWTNSNDRKQIYLLGNPAGWWISTGALIVYGCNVVVLALFNRRNITVADPVVHRHLLRSGGFIALAWAAHYFPFFLMGRSLFLHHYLPASIFAYMAVAVVFQFFSIQHYQRFTLRRWNGPARALVPSTTALASFVVLIAIQTASFLYFAPLAYGTTAMTPEQVRGRMLLSSYDLHFQK
ncbi:Dolichyl-phosphate-mannose--protein mannosyltransferase 4 [Coemansia sp. IMI 209127]|nr:Dolichyl-phosphate-mannose--protein mannosyltransferase 4 [Coemansia sp. IMI 209127]